MCVTSRKLELGALHDRVEEYNKTHYKKLKGFHEYSNALCEHLNLRMDTVFNFYPLAPKKGE